MEHFFSIILYTFIYKYIILFIFGLFVCLIIYLFAFLPFYYFPIHSSIHLVLLFGTSIKGLLHPKMKILSLFTYPQKVFFVAS